MVSRVHQLVLSRWSQFYQAKSITKPCLPLSIQLLRVSWVRFCQVIVTPRGFGLLIEKKKERLFNKQPKNLNMLTKKPKGIDPYFIQHNT